MGNNAAYSTFQHTVISLYNQGVLTLELLDELAREYEGMDIDSGGDTGLVAKDGRDLETICLDLVEPNWSPGEPTTEDLARYGNDVEYWRGMERYYAWKEITDGRWGWC